LKCIKKTQNIDTWVRESEKKSIKQLGKRPTNCGYWEYTGRKVGYCKFYGSHCFRCDKWKKDDGKES
jgi:hypothetical protein